MKDRFIGAAIGILLSAGIVIFCVLNGFISIDKTPETNEYKATMKLESSMKESYVKDEETAKRIAEAIWISVYGESVQEEKPYKASLKGDVWTVTGALSKGKIGGTAEIEISCTDGRILKIAHGK